MTATSRPPQGRRLVRHEGANDANSPAWTPPGYQRCDGIRPDGEPCDLNDWPAYSSSHAHIVDEP